MHRHRGGPDDAAPSMCRTVAAMRRGAEEGRQVPSMYGLYGPECKGGGEDVISHEKKMRWLH